MKSILPFYLAVHILITENHRNPITHRVRSFPKTQV